MTKKKNNKSLVTLPCAEAGCNFHVYFDWNLPPIPAFIALDINAKVSQPERMPYLTCDNPQTPHTHRYVISKRED